MRQPHQIAREVTGERDWNNVYDSGCNFACIAMIVGIDPARLASELATKRFFAPDLSALARDLAGRRVRLVWDCNAPSAAREAIRLSHVWHQRLRRRTSFSLRYVGRTATRDHSEAVGSIAAARRRGLHVICGPEEHSHLVAGRIGRDFYVWDPDETEIAVEETLRGRFTLARLFRLYAGQPIEFWHYRLTVRIEARR